MLLYVLDSQRSSPGRQGFFMAVNAEGQISGSIGGGIMEHKFVELAKQRLQLHIQELSVVKQLHDKEATKNRSGMICSGEQTILLYTLAEKDLTQINKIINCLENFGNATLQLSPSGIVYLDQVTTSHYTLTLEDDDHWIYTEKIGYSNRLFIIGGGHCALALSSLMTSMDFYITVYDDRTDLHTMKENEFAHELVHIDSYEEVRELIPESDTTFVVLMTFGYRTDDQVLRVLMDRKFRYIGLLGSRAKVKKMFDDYRKEGIHESRIQRIHAPVGFSINSQTPEEIAVSIAAEIISVQRSGR